MQEYLLIIVGIFGGLAGGFFIGQSLLKKSSKNQEEEAERKATSILRDAKSKADSIRRDRQLEAKEHFLKLKSEFVKKQ